MMRFWVIIALLAAGIACRTNESPEQQVNDTEIMANVKAKLAQELGAATVTNISVNVTNGIVTLTGTVHNTAEKSRAVSLAQSVPRVVRVSDNLQVMASPQTRSPGQPAGGYNWVAQRPAIPAGSITPCASLV